MRRWVARRGLYWPAPVPLPSCIRWLPAGLLSQQHQGAGAIVAAFAPHDDWAERWPHLPNPTCIELVHLDAEGLPALDKPAEEEWPGETVVRHSTGSGLPPGRPKTGESAVGLVIVEGLADALAYWRPGPLRPRLPSVGSAASRRTGSWTGCPAGRVLRSTPTTTPTA